jgi:hypothetical protein
MINICIIVVGKHGTKKKADKTQLYRVLSGLSETCNVTSCSEIC